MLGAAAGLALGAAILLRAPGVGAATGIGSGSSAMPAAREAVAVAAVIVPARDAVDVAGEDRGEAKP